jgi:RNA polymerase-binding protein DksA
MEERHKTTEEARKAGEIFETNEEEATGELSTRDEYGAELAEDMYEREKQAALRENLRAILREIDRALAKIENGSYGFCETCGKPIPVERLDAEPYAIRCVEDQEKIEGIA